MKSHKNSHHSPCRDIDPHAPACFLEKQSGNSGLRRNLAFLLVLLLMLLGPAIGGADETNYCHDPTAEAEWLALLAENPKDFDVQALHALRMGLCIKVDQGVLTVAEATRIFENGRSALMQNKATQEQLESERFRRSL